VESVLKPGQELDVTVVEVDRERGRIGLRLSDDPSVEGKSAEELTSVGTGSDGGGRRDGGDRRPRRDGDRGGGRRPDRSRS